MPACWPHVYCELLDAERDSGRSEILACGAVTA